MKSLYLPFSNFIAKKTKKKKPKIKQKPIIVVEATYGLNSHKYFRILNLTFGGRGLVTRRFGLNSNSRGAGLDMRLADFNRF